MAQREGHAYGCLMTASELQHLKGSAKLFLSLRHGAHVGYVQLPNGSVGVAADRDLERAVRRAINNANHSRHDVRRPDHHWPIAR